MLARMRVGAVIALAVIGLGLAGCAQNNGQQPFNQAVATRPAGINAADLPEAKAPEILPDTHMAAGRLHETQGHLARAAEQYQQAVAVRPDYIEAYNRLGIVLDRMGKFKEADEVFNRAIRRAAQEAFLRNNLAFSYIMQSRWREAEVELAKAVELKPDFTRAHVNLGMVLAQQERYDEALTRFELALTKADAYYNLGLMYQSKRKAVEAARAFKTAVAIDAKLLAAQKRLEMLPADVVKQAEPFAWQPLPTPVAAAQPTETPATQPAEAVAASDIPPLPRGGSGGSAGEVSGMMAAVEAAVATQPAEQATPDPAATTAPAEVAEAQPESQPAEEASTESAELMAEPTGESVEVQTADATEEASEQPEASEEDADSATEAAAMDDGETADAAEVETEDSADNAQAANPPAENAHNEEFGPPAPSAGDSKDTPASRPAKDAADGSEDLDAAGDASLAADDMPSAN